MGPLSRRGNLPLRDAKVLNGLSLRGMNIETSTATKDELGYLISNHLIRKAAYEAVKDSSNVTLICDAKVTDLRTDADGGTVTMADGRTLHASLLVAADSRFSCRTPCYGHCRPHARLWQGHAGLPDGARRAA